MPGNHPDKEKVKLTWIATIAFDAATGRLKQLYDRVRGPGNKIDNIMLAHSLRPHSMEGHMALYKNVLHHNGNELPKWFLESIGVFVSLLNHCNYCVDHHFAGLCRLLNDDARAAAIRAALQSGELTGAFTRGQCAALKYAATLTSDPKSVTAAMLQEMRDGGLGDGEILEINQVTAYFAYANRTVLGLGINIKGDVLGLSPGNSDRPDDWHHN